MCLSSSAPSPPPIPAAPPTMSTEGVQRARSDQKKRLRAAAGRASTIKTTPDLLGSATTTTGNLLGS